MVPGHDHLVPCFRAELAKRKLRAHGYNVIDVPYGAAGGIDPMRLAASLIIPAWLPDGAKQTVIHEVKDR